MSKDNNQLKKLRDENDDLKKQIGVLHDELKNIKKKMELSANSDELEHSVEHCAEYDDLRVVNTNLMSDLKRIDENLSKISIKVYEIDDAIEALTAYSYQYNIKILGIPQTNDSETAQETVKICLKLFNELHENIHDYDIDIAHRVKSRSNDSTPIVCKFTRRVAKETVMSKRKDLKDVNLQNIVSSEDHDDDSSTKILIFDHLTPKKQDLLKKAKSVQREIGYAFCWVKNSQILMREDNRSRVIKINNEADLERLNPSIAPTTNGWMFPPHQQMPFGHPVASYSGRGVLTRSAGRGRGGYNTRNRAASSQS